MSCCDVSSGEDIGISSIDSGGNEDLFVIILQKLQPCGDSISQIILWISVNLTSCLSTSNVDVGVISKDNGYWVKFCWEIDGISGIHLTTSCGHSQEIRGSWFGDVVHKSDKQVVTIECNSSSTVCCDSVVDI